MDQGLISKSKNIIVDLYHTFVEPLLPIFEKTLKVNILPERRNEEDLEMPKLVENLFRYSKMMTTKVNLTSVAMESE